VRHRVYVPEIGRWTRRDPIGYVDGVGLYEYVGATALIANDSSGLIAVPGQPWNVDGVDLYEYAMARSAVALPPLIPLWIAACAVCVAIEIGACEQYCRSIQSTSMASCMLGCLATGPCNFICIGATWIIKKLVQRRLAIPNITLPPPPPPPLRGAGLRKNVFDTSITFQLWGATPNNKVEDRPWSKCCNLSIN